MFRDKCYTLNRPLFEISNRKKNTQTDTHIAEPRYHYHIQYRFHGFGREKDHRQADLDSVIAKISSAKNILGDSVCVHEAVYAPRETILLKLSPLMRNL